MIIKPKQIPRENEFRIKNGFAFFPEIITKTKTIWLGRYTRWEVCHVGTWLPCDIENNDVNWMGEWHTFSYLGILSPVIIIGRIPEVTNSILPKNKIKRVKKTKTVNTIDSKTSRLESVE